VRLGEDRLLLVGGQEVEELGAGDVVDQRLDALLLEQRKGLLDEGVGHGALLQHHDDVGFPGRFTQDVHT